MPLPLGWGAAMVGMGLVSYLWTRGSSTPSDLPRGTTHRQEPVVQKPTEPPRRVVNGTVHVFWDIENCQVPIGVHPSMVVQNIWRLRTSRGYSPSRIVAATSSAKLSTFLRNSLQSSGVELLDRPSSKPSAADMILLEEVQRFTLSHSDPSVAGVM
ncbi:hypothetical protein CALCODRAFT_493669 [Calocera cornea HHB12733]|uniref:NYN domain-containing protein n=1 Tax=Calocera cornea HHB12733 TaxID=1353952 RepID=A0A165HI55_9BASI|nr:hypothetical protein CALCODRAFT_493669 [Calocera cornea HHB12733]